jgi:hypothetical protein
MQAVGGLQGPADFARSAIYNRPPTAHDAVPPGKHLFRRQTNSVNKQQHKYYGSQSKKSRR